jgi:hypothetical protein
MTSSCTSKHEKHLTRKQRLRNSLNKKRSIVTSDPHTSAHQSIINCPKCRKKCKDISNLKQHLPDCLKKTDRFKCSMCRYSNNDRYRLRDHMKNVHMNIEQKNYYKCPKCDRQYKHRKHMRAHLMHVCGKRIRYWCEHCDYKCTNRGYMLRHFKKKHPYLFPDDRFICKLCGENCYTLAILSRHLLENKCFNDKSRE